MKSNITFKSNSKIPILFLISLLILICSVYASDKTAYKDTATAEIIPPAIDYNDGPHIFRHSDSLATVLYFCDSSLIKQEFVIKDTLRFNGLCGDSLIEYIIPIIDYRIPPCEYQNVTKIFAISDTHGEYEMIVDILKNSGVIDDNLHWIWGDGHLVVDGDVFDRGDMVTESLWLIYNLEQEAAASGGAVHLLLGNHELMVLRGDNRYVNEKYLDGIVKKSRIRHEDLYGPDSELGRWLRSKNTIEKINDILFVHGGISPSIRAAYSRLDRLNDDVRRSLDLRSSQYAFDEEAQLLFRGLGPFWYRGFHYEMENSYPQDNPATIDSILSRYGVDAVVVGHTNVDSVMGLYGGRVFAIDVLFEDLGTLQALLWENGKFYLVTGSGELQPLE